MYSVTCLQHSGYCRRSFGAYEEVLRMAKDTALQEMQAQAAQLGANAVIGVDLDYETVGRQLDGPSLMLVNCQRNCCND